MYSSHVRYIVVVTRILSPVYFSRTSRRRRLHPRRLFNRASSAVVRPNIRSFLRTPRRCPDRSFAHPRVLVHVAQDVAIIIVLSIEVVFGIPSRDSNRVFPRRRASLGVRAIDDAIAPTSRVRARVTLRLPTRRLPRSRSRSRSRSRDRVARPSSRASRHGTNDESATRRCTTPRMGWDVHSNVARARARARPRAPTHARGMHRDVDDDESSNHGHLGHDDERRNRGIIPHRPLGGVIDRLVVWSFGRLVGRSFVRSVHRSFES